MDPDVTETSSRSFFMRDLRPETPLEKLLDLGQHLPGALGWICYRKLKRRLSNRSYAVFDQMLEQIGAGDIVIDLGANVGEITQQMAATGATVHAFEPDPETFTHLQNATKDLNNVVLHQAAVGGEDGTVTLFRPPSWQDEQSRRSASKANSIMTGDRTAQFDAACEVELIDFARFLNELPTKVKVIKVDIEGAEWAMLRAVEARALDRFDAMFIETHERFDLSILPEVRAMQARFAQMDRPYINLYWK